METEQITYFEGKTPCKAFLAYEPGHKRPVVLVAHAWRGQDDFARQKAINLAERGYIGFAIDLYGHGKCAKDDREAESLMTPLYIDRSLLQKRLLAAFEFARKHPMADSDRIGAIGFCFGGLAVIELLRSGAPVRGVVGFHAVLNDRGAKRAPTTQPKGAILLLHGHDDPLTSPEDLKAFQEEMTKEGVDWQIHIYGHTLHAFTNPVANAPEAGKLYSPKADHRSWQAMCQFFAEKLN